MSIYSLARRLSPYIADQKPLIVTALIAAIVASFSEGFGVGMMVPLLQSIFNQGGEDFMSRLMSDHLQIENPALRLGLICLIILAAVIFKNFFQYRSTTQMAKIREILLLRLRQGMFRQLQAVEMSFFGDQRLGDLMQIQFGEVERVKQGFDFLLKLISQTLTCLIFILFLLFLSWQLTLLTTTLLAITIWIVNSIQKVIQRKGERMTHFASRLNSNTLEALSGIHLIKASASEEREIKRFDITSKQLLRQSYGFEKRVHLIMPITETVGIATALSIVFFSYTILVPRGLISVAGLLTFVIILLRLLPLSLEINFLRGQLSFSIASFDRILNLLRPDDKPYIRDGNYPFTGLRQGISLRNVMFGYETDRPVLHNVSFEIPKGKTIALIGGSGSGKSTITKLLLRFHDVTQGNIEIDGIDIRDYELETLRKRIATVSQETFLFNMSVRDNMAYGLIKVPEEQIIEAARRANAHEFIMNLPDGYDTPLGDRGIRLSGGQRQRLSIARALLRNPDILILDEATSNLDPESERLVQEALDRVCIGRTTIIVAHRFSTIEHADQIVVLDRGKVREIGTWQELMAKDGLFRQLYNLQCVSI